MKRYVTALRRAAEVVDVPGTPRTLRLDEVREAGGDVTVRRSFDDPEVHVGQALLAHLRASQPVTVEKTSSSVRVVTRSEEIHSRFTPREWVDYLNGVQLGTGSGDGAYVVPAGVPQDGGLPIWAIDDLDETAGAHGPVVTLVAGRLVGASEE